MPGNPVKLLFIINPGSGNNKTDWKQEIQTYFQQSSFIIELFELSQAYNTSKLKDTILKAKPDRVIAVGGDGTLKLVAESTEGMNLPIGLLPAGSANGMANELGIPVIPAEAMDIIAKGSTRKIHLTEINNEKCIHLSDIGFNAFVVKKFESEKRRGMWGYVKAAWKVLWAHNRLKVRIKADNKLIQREAAMVVIANATKYGTGVVINPAGKLDDDLFEIVIIKKISFKEIFKMRFTHSSFDTSKTELFQASSLEIHSRRKAHFQVDGEYMGKTNKIHARILPAALEIIAPRYQPQ
ncbi:MAG: YegS/Rv2252/BmrU family lipid kinase [Chitinophagaceae bacterium]|nr:YegS/Rv2252/BmrU family lipid kinase [Chitinophagaceae bacterium]